MIRGQWVRAACATALLTAVGALGQATSSAAAVQRASVQATADSSIPFDNPLGPFIDVTRDWQHYQPSSDFCIEPNVVDIPAASDATATGTNPACRLSGFAASAKGLVEVKITTPALCDTCRRYFLDYALIAPNSPAAPTSHGHAYFRPMSFNQTYTVPPTAHSPNIKNFTNDQLVTPPRSVQFAVVSRIDPELMTYAADTANFAHTAAQGPYYVGPWYLNSAGQRIDGAYVDIDLGQGAELPDATLNDVVYAAAFDDDPSTCIDAVLLGQKYADANYLYGGCLNSFGVSALPGLDPWSD
jgi:hypothetical protein